jgi:hypothetical protein
VAVRVLRPLPGTMGNSCDIDGWVVLPQKTKVFDSGVIQQNANER